MDERNDDYEMPIPDEAVGIRVLVLDSNWASLMHTSELLEDATYKVTNMQLPNQALNLIQEQPDAFHLVVAAMQMQGMDCFTFLRRLRTLSNVPVVLTSFEMYSLLTVKILKQGVSEYFELPLRRADARCLWQHVFSRGKNIKTTKKSKNAAENGQSKTLQSDNNPEQVTRDPKGKGVCKENVLPENDLVVVGEGTKDKENEQEICKRKRSDGAGDDKETDQQPEKRKGLNCINNVADKNDDASDKETGNADDPKSSDEAAVKKKAKKTDENPAVTSNAELQPMFIMNAIANSKGKGKEILTTPQSEFTSTNAMLIIDHDQNSKSVGCSYSKPVPKPGRRGRKKKKTVSKASHDTYEVQSVPNAWYAGNGIQTVPNKKYARNEFQTVLDTSYPQNEIKTVSIASCPRNKIQCDPFFNTVSGVEKVQHRQQGTWNSILQPASQFLVAPQPNVGKNISQNGIMNGESFINSSLLQSNNNQMLGNKFASNQQKHKGKIDHFQQPYWTNTQLGNGSFIQNFGYNGASSSTMGYFTPPSASAYIPPHQTQPPAENHVQPIIQNSYNFPMEPTISFQTPKYPYSDSIYTNMLPSDSLTNNQHSNSNYNTVLPTDTLAYPPLSESNYNKTLSFDNLTNQAIHPTVDLDGPNLQNITVLNSSEANMNNAGGSNLQLLTDEDELIFEEILAELRDDNGDNDLRSVGFNIDSYP